MMASQQGHEEIVNTLINAKADVNICENVRNCPHGRYYDQCQSVCLCVCVCVSNRALGGVLCSFLPKKAIWT